MLNNTQVHATYREDSDKCSHLSDLHTSLHLDKAATNNRLHSANRSFLQNKARNINKLCFNKPANTTGTCFNKTCFSCCCNYKSRLLAFIFFSDIQKICYNLFFFLCPQPHKAADYFWLHRLKVQLTDYIFIMLLQIYSSWYVWEKMVQVQFY